VEVASFGPYANRLHLTHFLILNQQCQSTEYSLSSTKYGCNKTTVQLVFFNLNTSIYSANAIAHINEITPHGAKLVLRWVTFVDIPSWYITSHVSQLNVLHITDGKLVLSKGQWQCSFAGKTWHHIGHSERKGRVFIQRHFSMHAYSQSAQTWITRFFLQITQCLPFLCKHSPDGATHN